MRMVNFITSGLVTAMTLTGTVALADTGGRIDRAPRTVVIVTPTPSFPHRPFDYDDRAVPHGADAPQNFPVPHPDRALDVYRIAPAYAFSGLTLRDRQAVQMRLRNYGYYTGNIDGAWGPQTWSSVQAYAAALNLTPGLADMAGSLGVYQHITG